MKKYSFALVLLFVIGLTFSSCGETKKAEKESATELKEVKEKAETKEIAMAEYQCPMQCEKEKTYHEPGSCPKCKMDLKKVE